MKIKSLVISALLFSSVLGIAQNVQLHYDFGKDRKLVTTTFEMFKPDKYGSTFFFVDLDYSADTRNVENGVSLAYMEIARSFKWNENQKFEPRIEFNSGNVTGFPIKNSWLAGAQYTFNSEDYSKILTLQANLKQIQDGKKDGDNLTGFQLTAVWAVQLLEGKVSLTGFADFWREDVWVDSGNAGEIKEYVFLTEPQVWYNTCKNFAIGGEIEISNNFGTNDGFMINPTLAAKWTF
nr:DUF5020 family protein [uncultured Carboxylicivirga sp.]